MTKQDMIIKIAELRVRHSLSGIESKQTEEYLNSLEQRVMRLPDEPA